MKEEQPGHFPLPGQEEEQQEQPLPFFFMIFLTERIRKRIISAKRRKLK